MKRFAGLVLIVTLTGCGQDNPTITYENVPLYPDNPDNITLGRLTFTGGLELNSGDERFGGWSAIEVSEGGSRLLALSDSAYWMTLQLDWSDTDQLISVSDTVIHPLLDQEGQALMAPNDDAEGLAALSEGRFLVSFEREHRLWSYDIGDDWSQIETALPSTYPAPPGVDRLRDNGGMEALAVREGGVWAGIEHPIIDGQPHTVWSLSETQQQAHSIRLAEGYGLTALARYDETTLIAVERFWARDIGNRIRIVLIRDEDFRPGGAATPDDETDLLAAFTPDMTVDNFEGAAVFERDGDRYLLLISDDNYSESQRSLLLSFKLP